MIIAGIYSITNPSGKVYIGQALDIERRWKRYNCLDCKKQVKLYRSLLKYGVENHEFEIEHVCEDVELNEMEKYFINYYDSFNSEHGLNLTSGGDHYKMSEETKTKIAIINSGENNPFYGRKHTEESKDKMRLQIFTEERKLKLSERQKGNKNMLGKKHSDESKAQMSEKRKGIKPSEETIKKRADKMRGRKMSEEERLKHCGHKCSDETKDKISKANLGENNGRFGKMPHNAMRVKNIITGEIFNSISEAANSVGISFSLLARKLKQGNKCGFKLLKQQSAQD